jgi:hypothetical protein
MTLEHKYTIVCEHARQEPAGRWTLIGLFPSGILATHVPLALPMLTFYQEFRADTSGPVRLRGRLTQLDSGAQLAEMPPIQIHVGSGTVSIPVGLGNIQFLAFGSYMWSVEIEGQKDPILTEFQVKHVPQQVPFPMPGWKS